MAAVSAATITGTLGVLVIVGPNGYPAQRPHLLSGAAWLVSFYLTSMGTFYRDTLIRFGFDKEVQAVLAANTPKLAAAVPADAEVLLDELIVYGTPAEARRRLARWYEAGAVMPGLMFRPGLTAEETRCSLEAFVPMLESR